MTNSKAIRAVSTLVLLAVSLPITPTYSSPIQFSNEVLADGPIGYWRFGEIPGSTTAADSSGQGNNGYYSSSGITLGHTGFTDDTAALFDGTKGRVVVPNKDILNPAQITMEAKVKWGGRNGFQQRIFEKSAWAPIPPPDEERGQAQAQYGLSITDGGRVQVEIRTGRGTTTPTCAGSTNVVCAQSVATISVGVETHIAATFDENAIRIYINGALDSETFALDHSGPIQAGPFELGIGNQSVRNRPFNGLIDEAALYPSALSAERIRAHYQSQFAERVTFQYAVKFVCGKSAGRVVAPGTYFTAINVHNPNEKGVSFKKKFAIALPGEKPGPISRFFDAKLAPDEAFEIDCPDIKERTRTTGDFFKGFAVIESTLELDVVAVYTAAGTSQQVETIDIERVEPRRQRAGGKPDLIPVPDPRLGFCRRQGMKLTVTVKNQGSSDAGPSITKVDFGAFGTATQPTPALAAGASIDLVFTIPAGCFDPDCNFRITVDSNGQVDESNEGNNNASGTCVG